MNQGIMLGVALACRQLADEQLAALNLAVQAGWDASNLSGYEHIAGLFTEANGTQMHEDAKVAFAKVALKRLG